MLHRHLRTDIPTDAGDAEMALGTSLADASRPNGWSVRRTTAKRCHPQKTYGFHGCYNGIEHGIIWDKYRINMDELMGYIPKLELYEV